MKKNEKKILNRQKIGGKRTRLYLFPIGFFFSFFLFIQYFHTSFKLPMIFTSTTPNFRYISQHAEKLKETRNPTLSGLSSTMRKMEKIALYHVYQTPPWSFTILQKERRPLYALAHEKTTYFMTDGSLCHSSISTHTQKSPTIAGLKAPTDLSKKKICRPPTATTKQILSETLLISRLLRGTSVSIASFSYDPDQGYSILLEPSASLVHLGHPPFTKKMERLYQILNKNQNKSLQIDLDFENKAFIKEVNTKI